MPKNYVYDKKNNVMIPVEFGDHFSGILQCIIKEFGIHYVIERTQEELDKYILENIELKGENRPKQWYSQYLFGY